MSITAKLQTVPWVPSVVVVESSGRAPHLSWGIADDYPSRISEFVNNSATAQAAVDVIARFLGGRGFVDEDLNEMKMARGDATVRDLLYQISLDLAVYGGFACHVQYNLAGRITNVVRADLRYYRLDIPDSLGTVNSVWFHRDWDLQAESRRDQITAAKIHLFNTDGVLEQIKGAGGIEKFKGQLVFARPGQQFYPKAPCNSVIPDMISERKAGELITRQFTSGFMGKTIVQYPHHPESPAEKRKILDQINSLQGVDGKSIMVIWGSSPEMPVQVQALADNFSSDSFEVLETTLRMRIARAYGVPLILLSIYRAGALGASTEYADAFKIQNSQTDGARKTISALFKKIGDLWHDDSFSGRNWEIDSLVWTNDQNNPVSAAKLEENDTPDIEE